MGYILEDIANKGDAASIVSQVKFLVKNYQLSSNVQTSVGIIRDRKAREEATTHGKAAVEFLAQIYEYFSDQVDDFTGKKFPPKEVLQFAQGAVQAAQKELDALLSSYPPEWTQLVNTQLAEEQQSSAVSVAADSS